jgi:chromosome segregation ATPase
MSDTDLASKLKSFLKDAHEENERLIERARLAYVEASEQIKQRESVSAQLRQVKKDNAALRKELEQWTTDRFAWMMRAKKAEKALASAREVIAFYAARIDKGNCADTWLKENPE